LLAGYEGMKQREKQMPPHAKARLIEAALRLVQLYEAVGNQGKAEMWRQKLRAQQDNPKQPRKDQAP
jgi:hypothetical protein